MNYIIFGGSGFIGTHLIKLLKAEAVKDVVVDNAEAAKDAASDKAEAVKDTAADNAEAVKDAAADEAEAVKDATADKAETVKDAAADGAAEAATGAAGTADTAKAEKLSQDTAQKTADSAKEATAAVKEETAQKKPVAKVDSRYDKIFWPQGLRRRFLRHRQFKLRIHDTHHVRQCVESGIPHDLVRTIRESGNGAANCRKGERHVAV